MQTNSFAALLTILLTAAFTDNLIFEQLLGLHPLLVRHASPKEAVKNNWHTAVLLFCSTALFYPQAHFLLIPLHLESLQLVMLVLLLLAIAYILDRIERERRYPNADFLHRHLPVAVLNTAVLGTPLLAAHTAATYPQVLFYAAGAGGGFLLATALFAALQQKLFPKAIPHCLRGLPLDLLLAAFVSAAFLGFQGLHF